MSNPTYTGEEREKTAIWLGGAIKTPPFSKVARFEAGMLLRRLQKGEVLSMPHSKPMAAIGPRCHELRITDETMRWRIIYRVDADVILVAEIFSKRTRKTPKNVIKTCRRRLRGYDNG